MELLVTSELDAVNVCLEVIGEEPVNIIPTSGVTEATIAYKILTRISRETQSKELHCNTETNYPLLPTLDGEYIIPQNVLRVDAMERSLDIVQRGNRLYDKANHTFKFWTANLKVEIVFFLPFTQLPEHVRNLIAIRAARVFQRNFLGSTNQDSMTAADEQRAIINFERAEGKTDDRTILQSATSSGILRRRF